MSIKVATKTILSLKVKTAATLIALVSAVALPQLFHLLGASSGLGTSLGEVFLPMHLPIIMAGLFAGPVVGAISGALAPIISFFVSGMPIAAMLPFMVVELCAYGAFAGLLSSVNMPSIIKVLSVQLCGRLVRMAAVAIAVYAFGFEAISPMSVIFAVKTGAFGILLQLAIIPLALYRLNCLNTRDAK